MEIDWMEVWTQTSVPAFETVDKAVTLIFHKGLVHSADVSGRRHFDLFVVSWTSPVFFRIWFLRLACGTAVKSVCISISVSLLVRAQGEPAG